MKLKTPNEVGMKGFFESHVAGWYDMKETLVILRGLIAEILKAMTYLLFCITFFACSPVIYPIAYLYFLCTVKRRTEAQERRMKAMEADI